MMTTSAVNSRFADDACHDDDSNDANKDIFLCSRGNSTKDEQYSNTRPMHSRPPPANKSKKTPVLYSKTGVIACCWAAVKEGER
eukprot:scaffold656239_cov90-Attheya_sp.AAC.1